MWIRTCYASELNAACEEIIDTGRREIGADLILDDPSLYRNLGHDWTNVFLRLPQLPDTVPYYNDGYPENDEQALLLTPPSNEDRVPLHNAVTKSRSAVYVVDDEAARERLVKVYFVDVHGEAVWWNKIEPEQINGFEVHPMGARLGAHFERLDDLPWLVQPGTVLDLGG